MSLMKAGTIIFIVTSLIPAPGWIQKWNKTLPPGILGFCFNHSEGLWMLFHHPYFQWYLESDCVTLLKDTVTILTLLTLQVSFIEVLFMEVEWILLGFLFSLLVWWNCLSCHMLHSCLIIKFWLCISSKLSFKSICLFVNIFLQTNQKAVRVLSTAKLKDNYDQHFHYLIFSTMYFISS